MTQRATILCPGPSLAALASFRGDGLTIAVNRAAIRFACDVWACGDPEIQQRTADQVIGPPWPWLFTAASTAAQIRDHLKPWRGPVREFESIDRGRIEHRWDTFTATAALVLAAEMGAAVIDVYGADWTGEEDFDGVKAGGNRSDERWKLERGIWNSMVIQLWDSAGIEVHRH